MNSRTDNRPATALIDVAPNAIVVDECGCNRARAVHERGDAAFCRATIRAVTGRG